MEQQAERRAAEQPAAGRHCNSGGSTTFNNNRNNPLNPQTPRNQLKQILPPLGITGPQQLLFALADGTGGFVIVNTNDLLGGLDKIGKEQAEYYVLGYTPSKEPEPGACHTLKVKVERSGTTIRSRTGYCDPKTDNVLSGTPAERDLEARGSARATPTVAATMQAPFFYISPDTARVDVALDIPSAPWKFTKEKGKFHSTLNIVGIAYRPDGGVGARFSDAVKVSFDDKKQAEEFETKPFHYEKQFEMASGKYILRVLFSSGADAFGKLETPLVLDPWNTNQFALSGLALSTEVHPAANADTTLEASLIEDRVPLIFGGLQIDPAGTNRFHKTGPGFVYAELYEPALAATPDAKPPLMGVSVQFLDAKTGAVAKDLGVSRIPAPGSSGNPAVPLALRLPVGELPVGSYRLQVTGADDAGHQTTRTADVEIVQ